MKVFISLAMWVMLVGYGLAIVISCFMHKFAVADAATRDITVVICAIAICYTIESNRK